MTLQLDPDERVRLEILALNENVDEILEAEHKEFLDLMRNLKLKGWSLSEIIKSFSSWESLKLFLLT